MYKFFTDWQDYFDIGNDTERWWRKHVGGMGIHLVHSPRAKGYDFRGEMGDEKVYIDVKFCRSKYRQPGWTEVFTNGKLTGIIKTAKENYNDDNVQVHICVLESGNWYLLDVKEMLRYWQKGELGFIDGRSKDDIGNNNRNRHWQLRGWDDERFLIARGPLKAELWDPQTRVGKAMDVNQWIKGYYPWEDSE